MWHVPISIWGHWIFLFWACSGVSRGFHLHFPDDSCSPVHRVSFFLAIWGFPFIFGFRFWFLIVEGRFLCVYPAWDWLSFIDLCDTFSLNWKNFSHCFFRSFPAFVFMSLAPSDSGYTYIKCSLLFCRSLKLLLSSLLAFFFFLCFSLVRFYSFVSSSFFFSILSDLLLEPFRWISHLTHGISHFTGFPCFSLEVSYLLVYFPHLVLEILTHPCDYLKC